jgi:hypothetical protein
LLGKHGRHLHGHGAMVRSMTAAAGGQTRVVTGLKQASERAEAEEQHEDQGSRAAHLQTMLHETGPIFWPILSCHSAWLRGHLSS